MTTDPRVPIPDPSVPGTGPQSLGTGDRPSGLALGPSTIDGSPTTDPVPSPRSLGHDLGTGPSTGPVPAGTGPSTEGTTPPTGTGPSGTGPSPTANPRSLSQQGRGLGPQRRPSGNKGPGRGIAKSRLIPGTDVPIPRGKIAAAMVIISLALTLVIAAPTLLSSQDLYAWAHDPHGLDLEQGWAVCVPVALDLAAIVCIGMTLIAAWRRERATVFALLIGVFAGTSAFAQYRHGTAQHDAGGAQDSWWAMPAFALLGPVLLEFTLHQIRKWARKDAGESVPALRWIVSPFRSFGSWKWSIRENLKPAEAWTFARDKRLLGTMKKRPTDAVLFAVQAVQSFDPYVIMQWLAARGTIVSQGDIDRADFDSVPTGHWDTWDGNDDSPSVPVPDAEPVPSRPVPSPFSGPDPGPKPAGTGPSPANGTGGVPTGTAKSGRGTVPPGTESPGTEGTEGLDKITGTRPILSAVDGADLAPLYERHRERLLTVKSNMPGWNVMPDRELTTEAIKGAGGFNKQGYACDIRRILRHERVTLTTAS